MNPLTYQILNHSSLKKFNTFGIDAIAENLIKVSDKQGFKDAIVWARENKLIPLILGGGSNVLFKERSYPLVIVNRLLGIKKVDENDDFVWVSCGAGEVWHEVVLYCIAHGWGGIENLSLIPGTVGAAPMQNIGAYGVEIKAVFESLESINLETLATEVFTNDQCQFGYRESIFKKELKDKYFITSIVLKLTKHHQVNTSYGAIKAVLNDKSISKPTIQDVSDAVIQIRQSKLPNPDKIGNAGSFFKNPVISADHFALLSKTFNDIPSYPQADGQIKVPAGWLIEQCGWKGSRTGDIGVHSEQALVLVNYGQGRGTDIEALAVRIRRSVQDKFEIDISPEVNII